MGPGAAAPQSNWGAARRRLRHRVRGLPRDGTTRGFLPVDVLQASFVGGEAAHDRAGGGLRAIEETERVGFVPHVHPLRFQSGVAREMVLH